MNLQAVLVKPVKHIDSWVTLILSFSALRESGSSKNHITANQWRSNLHHMIQTRTHVQLVNAQKASLM